MDGGIPGTSGELLVSSRSYGMEALDSTPSPTTVNDPLVLDRVPIGFDLLRTLALATVMLGG